MRVAKLNVDESPATAARFAVRGILTLVLGKIAAAHGATPRQVALRFIVRRPSVFAIPKAARSEHAADNVGAGDLRLTDAELARIDAAFPRGPQPRKLRTL